MGRRARPEEFWVEGVVERLAPYDVALVEGVGCPDAPDDELVERAATLLQLMPRNQRRETIEDLVCPHDQQRGREAVEALIDAAFATEDVTGRLRLVCAEAEEAAAELKPTPRPELPAERVEGPGAQQPGQPGSPWRRASRVARLVLGR
jgi:hypothetical protein